MISMWIQKEEAMNQVVLINQINNRTTRAHSVIYYIRNIFLIILLCDYLHVVYGSGNIFMIFYYLIL